MAQILQQYLGKACNIKYITTRDYCSKLDTIHIMVFVSKSFCMKSIAGLHTRVCSFE